MKMRIVCSLVGVFVIGQVTLADTVDSNHVQIVTNKSSAPKKVVKKPIAKVTKAKKVVSKKLSVRPRQAVVAKNQKAVIKRTVVAQPVQKIPGRRVSLANSNSARANGFTSSDPVNPILGGNTSAIAPNLTAKIKKEELEEKEVKWTVKLRSYNAVDLNALENYGPSRDYTIRAWERLNVDYHITKDLWIGVMPQYYHTWFQDQDRPQSSSNSGLTQSYASYLGDAALVFNDKNISTFGDKFVFAGRQEYFAPTSQASQTAGSYGESRTHLTLAKSIGKFDFTWTEELRYYFQSAETNAFLDNNGQPIVNTQYRLLNLLDIGFNFTSKLSFTLETGVVNESDYGDSYNGTPQTFIDYLVMNPDLTYEFTKNLGLSLGIWEVYNYTNPPTLGTGTTAQTASYTPFAPYNGNTAGSWSGTEAYLMGTIKF